MLRFQRRQWLTGLLGSLLGSWLAPKLPAAAPPQPPATPRPPLANPGYAFPSGNTTTVVYDMFACKPAGGMGIIPSITTTTYYQPASTAPRKPPDPPQGP
jgi:hypothetical protein